MGNNRSIWLRAPSLDQVCGMGVIFSGYLLYLLTLQPVIGWGTGAHVARYSVDLQLGLTTDHHNLRILLGALLNLDPLLSQLESERAALFQNLLSTILGGVSLGILYQVCRLRDVSRFASLVTAFSLGLSHLFWHVSVISGPYTLHAVLLLGVVYSTLRFRKAEEGAGWFYVTAFLIGLGLTDSFLFLALIPGLVLFLWMDDVFPAPREWGGAVLSFVLGSGLLIALLLFGTGEDRGLLKRMRVLFSVPADLRTMLSSPLAIAQGVFRYAGALFYQFPLFGFLIGGFGFWLDWRQDRAFLCLVAVPFLLFAFLADPSRSATSYYRMIGSFVLFSIWIGGGVEWIVSYMRVRRGEIESSLGSMLFSVLVILTLSPVLLYIWIPGEEVNDIFRHIYPNRSLGYRNERAYFLKPWKMNERSAKNFWKDTRKLPPGSILIADREVSGPLFFYRSIHSRTVDGAGGYQIKDPYSKPFRQHPVRTVRQWINSIPGADDPDPTSKTPGVYMIDSKTGYRRDQLEKEFHFMQIAGSRVRPSSPAGSGGSQPQVHAMDYSSILRILPRE